MSRRSRTALRVETLEDRAVPAVVGGFDPSFDTDGKLTPITGATLNGTAVQADGKIVVVGSSGADAFAARYNPNGSLDTTFGGTGFQTYDFNGTDTFRSVALQADGKIVIAGDTDGNDFEVFRLNTDGSLDNSFDTNGRQTVNFVGVDVSRGIAVQPDGKIVVVGSADTGGAFDFAVARLNPADGQLDLTFGGGTGKATVNNGAADVLRAVVIDSLGRIVGAGDDGTNVVVVRLNPDGTPDITFDTNGRNAEDIGSASDEGRGLALQPNGDIVVVGDNDADFVVLRFRASDGALDPTFGAAGKAIFDFTGADDPRAIAVQDNGRIVVVGDDGNDDLAVLALTPTGALDTTFNAGTGKLVSNIDGADRGRAVALDGNERIVIAGDGTDGFVARLIGTVEKGGLVAVGGQPNGGGAVFTPNAAGALPAAATATLAGFGGTTAVRTATGDVNGDGIDDAILVTGPGTAIRVAVISGADNTTVLVAPFDPFGGDFVGGGYVAAGDFDQDGKAEFVVTPDQGGGPRVSIFSRNPDGTVATRNNFFGIDDPNFRGGARAAVGDVNGDGVADLAVAAGFGGGPRIALFDGKTAFATTPTKLLNDFFAFPGADATTLRNGSFVAIGDVSGDGFADLVFGGGPGGAPRVFILSGALVSAGNVQGAYAAPVANFFVAGNENDRGGVRVAVSDLDGDEKADLLAGSGENRPAGVRAYLGKNVTGAGEPATFQDVSLFGGTSLTDGVFVG